MKAAVFYGIGDLRVEERAMPKAAPARWWSKSTTVACAVRMLRHIHEIIKPVIVLGRECRNGIRSGRGRHPV